MTRRDDTTNTLPHEFAINAAERAHQNNTRIWADGPGAPCEDDRNVAALYEMAWQMFRAGDIGYVCRNDLLEIAFR